MKVYLRILLVLGLFILGFASMNGAYYISQKSSEIELTAEASYYEFSDSNDSHNLLENSTKGFEDNSSVLHLDCTRMEINEQLGAQNPGLNQSRLRRGIDVSEFFKCVMQQLSLRDNGQVEDKIKTFYSNVNHKILPSCQYYVFALRHIII